MRKLLDGDAGLIHARQGGAQNDSTTLQCAAAKGHLHICKLLFDRGAEVYTNPMSTYPPVMHAAWNRHQHVVDYFLYEVPDKAAGTNGIGVTINLAARQGWRDLVLKHIAADPLSVHQRGWIGDSPLSVPSTLKVRQRWTMPTKMNSNGSHLFFVVVANAKPRSKNAAPTTPEHHGRSV